MCWGLTGWIWWRCGNMKLFSFLLQIVTNVCTFQLLLYFFLQSKIMHSFTFVWRTAFSFAWLPSANIRTFHNHKWNEPFTYTHINIHGNIFNQRQRCAQLHEEQHQQRQTSARKLQLKSQAINNSTTTLKYIYIFISILYILIFVVSRRCRMEIKSLANLKSQFSFHCEFSLVNQKPNWSLKSFVAKSEKTFTRYSTKSPLLHHATCHMRHIRHLACKWHFPCWIYAVAELLPTNACCKRLLLPQHVMCYQFPQQLIKS